MKRLGLLAALAALGTFGVTNARVRAGPAIGGSVRFRRSGSPVGIYVATVQALQGGFRARPTPACQIRCQSTVVDHGRFWTLTGGATVQWQFGRLATTVRLGGGLRSYSLYGADVVLIVPQPGEFWPAHFMGASTNAAMHTGIYVAWPVGENQLFASLEDFMLEATIAGRSTTSWLASAFIYGSGALVRTGQPNQHLQLSRRAYLRQAPRSIFD